MREIFWKLLSIGVVAAVLASCASEPTATSSVNSEATSSASAVANGLYVQKIADNTYVTYGYGVSEADARSSAIRNGLQYATQQLVISEIKIESDELVTDLLYSTMNGYIEKFDVLESVKKGDEYFVRATLKISDTEIKATVDRFTGIGVGIENTSSVDSDAFQSSIESAYAEMDRRTNQIFVARKLYEEMARGWPEQAYNITLKELTVDKSNPTVATLVASVAYDEDWLDSFEAHQKLIGDLMEWAPSDLKFGNYSWQMIRICFRKVSDLGAWKRPFDSRECVSSPIYQTQHYVAAGRLGTTFYVGRKELTLADGKIFKEDHNRRQIFRGNLTAAGDPFSDKNSPIYICAFDSKRQLINRLQTSSTHLVFNPKKERGKLEVFVRTPQLLTRKFPVSQLVRDGRYPEYFRFSVGSPCDDVY